MWELLQLIFFETFAWRKFGVGWAHLHLFHSDNERAWEQRLASMHSLCNFHTWKRWSFLNQLPATYVNKIYEINNNWKLTDKWGTNDHQSKNDHQRIYTYVEMVFTNKECSFWRKIFQASPHFFQPSSSPLHIRGRWEEFLFRVISGSINTFRYRTVVINLILFTHDHRRAHR